MGGPHESCRVVLDHRACVEAVHYEPCDVEGASGDLQGGPHGLEEACAVGEHYEDVVGGEWDFHETSFVVGRCEETVPHSEEVLAHFDAEEEAHEGELPHVN